MGTVFDNFDEFNVEYLNSDLLKEYLFFRGQGFSIYNTYNNLEEANNDLNNIPMFHYIIISNLDGNMDNHGKVYQKIWNKDSGIVELIDSGAKILPIQNSQLNIDKLEMGQGETENPIYLKDYILNIYNLLAEI